MAAALWPSMMPKVALPVDHRVTLREILRQAHHRVDDRLVPSDGNCRHVADHLGRFLEGGTGVSRRVRMNPECGGAPACQPVAHVGQRAIRGGRERAARSRSFQRPAQCDLFDLALFGGNHSFAMLLGYRKPPL